jgi:hypothetical protein
MTQKSVSEDRELSDFFLQISKAPFPQQSFTFSVFCIMFSNQIVMAVCNLCYVKKKMFHTCFPPAFQV